MREWKGQRAGLASATAEANMSNAAAPAPPAQSAGLNASLGHFQLLPSIKVPMRDGVNLATDVYLPKGSGPFPIILIRTPYGKIPYRRAWSNSRRNPVDFAREGYAVVIQDVRGKFESEGVVRNAKSERRDFEDTAKWLDAQSWSARRMGMWGCSYLGNTQAFAAVTDTPSLKAVNPHSAGGSWNTTTGRYNSAGVYNGGAREYYSTLSWYADNSSLFLKPDPAVDPETWAQFAHFYTLGPDVKVDVDELCWELPILGVLDRAGLPPTEFNTFASNPPESRLWWDEDNELIQDRDKIYTPALWVQNWNDFLSGEAIEGFHWAKMNAANVTARDNQYLIMGPGPHCYTLNGGSENAKIDDLELGDTRLPIWDIMLEWNNRWVKGDVHAIDGMSRVTYWLYGKNEWRTSSDMPVPGTRYHDMYLSSQKGANSLDGDGKLSFQRPRTSSRDTYRYDPANPVTTGDQESWALPLSDQRSIEARKDILVYTSEPLKKGVTVVGPIKMVLHVSSSAVDTDFTGKLVDVYPDGRAIQLQNGILRARYRNSFLKPELMTPGRIYEITVDLSATANWFAPGHRIRLEVSSSNFPRFDRNLNTGGDTYTECEGVMAENSVVSGPSTLSRLILPIPPD